MPQRCARCGAVPSVPRYRCPLCGSRTFTQTNLPRAGSIYSWTTMPVDEVVSTLVLVLFPDGTRSFGYLVPDAHQPFIGAEVELVGDLAVVTGACRLFRLLSPA